MGTPQPRAISKGSALGQPSDGVSTKPKINHIINEAAGP